MFAKYVIRQIAGSISTNYKLIHYAEQEDKNFHDVFIVSGKTNDREFSNQACIWNMGASRQFFPQFRILHWNYKYYANTDFVQN